MTRWFRHYAGLMRDEKLVRVAVKSKQPIERVIWVWGAILESASEVNDGGRYDFDADEAAYFLRCEPTDVCGIVDGLVSSGRLFEGVVVRWGDRQFDSDSSRERQRRYREKRRSDGHMGKQDSYGDDRTPSGDGEVTVQENIDRGQIQKTETTSSLRSDVASAPEKPSRKKPRASLPTDWEPTDEGKQYAASRGIVGDDLRREIAKFRNHHEAHGKQMSSWDAAWRTWSDNFKDFKPRDNGSGRPKSGSEQTIDVLRKYGASAGDGGEDRGAKTTIETSYLRRDSQKASNPVLSFPEPSVRRS